MLTEMRSLGTSLGNIDGRLSAIDNILDDISTSVTSIQEALSNLWLNAESAKDCMLSHDNRIVFVDKELALLRAKVDDQENTGRRKNLRIEGSESVVQFLTKILPKWLDLTPDSHFEIERAHRSLGPIPGADRPPAKCSGPLPTVHG